MMVMMMPTVSKASLSQPIRTESFQKVVMSSDMNQVQVQDRSRQVNNKSRSNKMDSQPQSQSQLQPQPQPEQTLQQQPIFVNKIISANNAFISSLDHLPCDIVRSLWIIQSLNLKIDRCKDQMNDIIRSKKLSDEESLVSEKASFGKVFQLEKRIEWLSAEVQCESKQLVKIVKDHRDFIENDLKLMDELVGYRESLKHDRNWASFCNFKREFLKEVKDGGEEEEEEESGTLSAYRRSSTVDDFGDFDSSVSESSLSPITPSMEYTPHQSDKNQRKKSVTPSSSGIKIRISLNDGKKSILGNIRKSTADSKIKKKKHQLPASASMTQEKIKGGVNETNIDSQLAESILVSQQETEDKELYCFCNGKSFGKMIACDNPKCKIEWFHYKCVGLTSAPDEKLKWFCSDNCRNQFWDRIKKKRKKNKGKW